MKLIVGINVSFLSKKQISFEYLTRKEEAIIVEL